MYFRQHSIIINFLHGRTVFPSFLCEASREPAGKGWRDGRRWLGDQGQKPGNELDGVRALSLEYTLLKNFGGGDSLVVPWLGLGAFSALDEVQSLVRELRSCKLCNETKKKKKEKLTKGINKSVTPSSATP